MLENRTVAVKRMSNAFMDEKGFHREVECLMMVKHKNVVRFLGYCADTQGSMERYNGKFVMADVHQRLLCFEYLPKGSLHEYISGRSMWHTNFLLISIFIAKHHVFNYPHILLTLSIHSNTTDLGYVK
jgi:serine/threonine protein kinase